jgi:hypothetical protein
MIRATNDNKHTQRHNTPPPYQTNVYEMASPASPRLPSPPPIPEDQLSPVPASPEQQKFFSNLDHNAARRIRPGTKAEDMAEGPPLLDLSEVRSA